MTLMICFLGHFVPKILYFTLMYKISQNWTKFNTNESTITVFAFLQLLDLFQSVTIHYHLFQSTSNHFYNFQVTLKIQHSTIMNRVSRN